MADFQWGKDSTPEQASQPFQWGKDSTRDWTPEEQAQIAGIKKSLAEQPKLGGILPVRASTPTQQTSPLEALGIGATQGAGFNIPGRDPSFAGLLRRSEEQRPWMTGLGRAVGGAPSGFAAGALGKLPALMGLGALESGAQAKPGEEIPKAIEGAALTGILGKSSELIGQKVLGPLARRLRGREASMAFDEASKIAEKAAKPTLTARAEAGNAASNYFRQVRDLGLLEEDLPAEARQLYQQGKKDLLDKAMNEIGPAITRKETTAEAFKQAIAGEGQRALELSQQAGPVRQATALLKRYGPRAAAAAVGGTVGGPMGAAAGGAMGQVFGPAQHAFMRRALLPEVQRPIARGLAATTEGLGEAAVRPGAWAPRSAARLVNRLFGSAEGGQ